MRIGIDARTLSGRYTGDRTYWRGLLGGLAATDQENEYFLYLKTAVEGEPPALGPNFQWRVLPEPQNDVPWMLRTFPDALARDQITVAHTQYNIPLLGTPCPIVTTIHDVTFALFPELFLPRDRWVLNALVPRSLRRAAHIIADSDCTRRDILRLYGRHVPTRKVTSILLAADTRYRLPEGGQETARQTANDRFKLGRQPYVLAVGVLQPRKNLSVLLDAFTQIKTGSTPLPHKLVITGKHGWKNEELERHRERLPEFVRAEVVFTGYVADDDLPLLYGGAAAFAYPSLYEGFGLPPLEALACGCPVLCSETSSLPEVVGDAGLLLPPGDVHAWADALRVVLTDPAAQARLRALGPARAAQFSWETTARKTLQVYQEVVLQASRVK